MAQTRRAQVLMEPEDYEALEGIARQRKTSVADLIRLAVHAQYLGTRQKREAAAEAIIHMDLPVLEWADAKAAIEDGYDAGLR